MTLDEAIAREKQLEKEQRSHIGTWDDEYSKKCEVYAEEHEQIANWLEELKSNRIALEKANGYLEVNPRLGYNKAIDEETINQIEFIKILANRLDANECPTRIKADAIRLRRELNTLSKMQDWDSRWRRMEEKCDK